MNAIYTTLFDRIISSEYPPDMRLKEEVLADEFKVSRTPVREALRLLAQDGLVDISPKKGARVLGFTVDDIEEIYEIRNALEQLALKQAITKLSIQALSDIRSEYQTLKDTSDIIAYTELDVKLHDYIIQSSGRRRLIADLSQLYRLLKHLRELSFDKKDIRNRATTEHLSLIDALFTRNLSLAQKILEEHIHNSKINAVSLIVRNGEILFQ